ncbi:unnamed protein product [Rhodiola kirilowii]
MSHLATAMSTLTSEPGRLPSQTILNPKANLSMMKGSNGKATLGEVARSPAYRLTNKHFNRRSRLDWNQEEDRPNDGKTWVTHADNGQYAFTVCITPPPITPLDIPASGWGVNNDLDFDSPKGNFSLTSEQSFHLEDQMTPRNETEEKVEPIKEQNDLIAKKRLNWSPETYLEMSKDPGAFTVTCVFGKIPIHHCLIDLGASVNILPYPLYCSLKLGPLKPPIISLELGDKSCIQPVGVLESSLLRVGNVVVPADFYVIPVQESNKDDPPTIILGRPFLYTTGAKINMGKGSLSLAFGGRTSYYNIYGNKRAKPLEQWSPDLSTSTSKEPGRINPGAEVKFDLSHPWDPNQ